MHTGRWGKEGGGGFSSSSLRARARNGSSASSESYPVGPVVAHFRLASHPNTRQPPLLLHNRGREKVREAPKSPQNPQCCTDYGHLISSSQPCLSESMFHSISLGALPPKEFSSRSYATFTTQSDIRMRGPVGKVLYNPKRTKSTGKYAMSDGWVPGSRISLNQRGLGRGRQKHRADG